MSKSKPSKTNKASKTAKGERMPVADQLRELINDTGLSVYAVAKGAGIAQPVLHRFCTGERDLTLTTADKLIAYFDLELKPSGKSRP